MLILSTFIIVANNIQNKMIAEEDDLIKIDDLVDEKWRILEIIGRGGYGQIYKAKNIDSDDMVAIKVENTKRKRQVPSL